MNFGISVIRLGMTAVFTGLFLLGCNLYPPISNQGDLTQLEGPGVARQAPDCAQCHKFPLNDVNHGYHIFSINVNRDQFGDRHLNGMVTCMDCHFSSIKHFKFSRSDTLWMDSAGMPITHPSVPSDRVMSIETYEMYRPIPYNTVDTNRGRALATELDTQMVHQTDIGKIMEWMTGPTHNNGRVDVNFPPNDIVLKDSMQTAYRPADLSCNLVACHQIYERYRWANKRKGISQCPSLVGENPDCFEPNDPRTYRGP